MTAHRIELISDQLTVDVDNDGRTAVAAITGAGASLRASHNAPALEVQYLEAPHSTAVMQLDGSTGAPPAPISRARDRGRGDTRWLVVVVTAEDLHRVSVRRQLRTQTGSAALTSMVEVTNISGDELLMGALPSLSLALKAASDFWHSGMAHWPLAGVWPWNEARQCVPEI